MEERPSSNDTNEEEREETTPTSSSVDTDQKEGKNKKPKSKKKAKEPIITKEDLVPGRSWLLHNVLTKEECEHFINVTEKEGYQDSADYAYMYRDRDNDRLMLDDPVLSKKVWKRIKDFIPDIGPCKKKNLNERWRFCRYKAGQYFGKHCDGVFTRSRTEASMLTLMIYLNTSGEDFKGGETVFYDWKAGSPLNTSKPTQVITPAAGLCLVFHQQTMLHEGMPIKEGVKYIMRSDVMYDVCPRYQQYL
jgi:prolyl 4-hydroxylase